MMPSLTLSRAFLAAVLLSCFGTSLSAQRAHSPVVVAIGEPITVSVDLDELRQGIDPSTVSTTPVPAHATVEYVSGADFLITARTVGVDSVALGYCDATGACDTAFLEITSRLPRDITATRVLDTVGVPGSVKTFCVDTTELPGTIVSVTDLCADPPRTFVDFTYAQNTHCVKYRGITLGGTDSTCIVLCDDLGFCDTTTVIVTTDQPRPFPDAELEFYIDKGQMDFTTLDFSEFSLAPRDLSNVCEDESGTFVAFEIDADAGEVSFAGLEVGMERACVLAKASNGTQKRYLITVHVVTRSPGVDTIRVPTGQVRTWCFGDYELVGDPVGIFDACPDPAALVTPATTAEITCLDLEAGAAVGTQDLCVNLCDEGGRCDMIELHVIVYAPDLDAPPEAVDDFVDVPERNTVTYGILDNDRSDVPVTSVRIVSGPSQGSARLDQQRRLVYDRNPGAPCETDVLVYELCNANGCDRATVTLRPACDDGGGTGRGPITITRSLSPNADGIGDTWEITNILDYPDNQVRVFNRWGNLVFSANSYRNDWEGTFQDGKALPDGTYFYQVVIEGAEPITSYLQLRR